MYNHYNYVIRAICLQGRFYLGVAAFKDFIRLSFQSTQKDIVELTFKMLILTKGNKLKINLQTDL